MDLPDGITVEDAVSASSRIASGLQRPASTVWLSGVPDEEYGHASRLLIQVTNAPLRSIPVPEWPLAKEGEADLFDPVPIGVDPRGQWVYARLMFSSGVIGAIPRMGKTFTLRLFELAAALDPTAELHIFDLKGGVDHKPLAPRCSTFVNTADERQAPRVLAALEAIEDDMDRRYETLDELTDTDPIRCPEGQVTRELADDPELGLHPVLVVIEETQTAFVDWKKLKSDFERVVTRLVKQGPAAGVITLVTSQSVNKQTIPRSISTQAGIRICLKVTDDKENNQILGTSASRRGFRAHELTTADKGIGYLAGEEDGTVLTRFCYVDGPQATAIADSAIGRWEQRGPRSRPSPGGKSGGIVEDVMKVWPADKRDERGRMHLADLAVLLAGQLPDIYGGQDNGSLVRSIGARLRSVSGDVVRQQLRIEGTNRAGVRWADLVLVAAEQDIRAA